MTARGRAAARWGGSFALAALVHGGLAVAVLVGWRGAPDAGGLPLVVELEPIAAAPSPAAPQSPPGPEQTQTADTAQQTTPPEPEPQVARPDPAPEPEPAERPDPTPPDPEPVQVAAVPPPVEVPVAVPEPPPPKPAPPRDTRRPEPRPTPARAAPTTAPAAAATAAPVPSAGRVGEGAGRASPAWNSLIVAHLQRHKRYPAEAQARGLTGTAVLAFTIDRSGRVLASRLAGGSGVPTLDQETLALIQRAQPLPPAPPDVAGTRFSFAVPIRYTVR